MNLLLKIGIAVAILLVANVLFFIIVNKHGVLTGKDDDDEV